MIKGKVKDIDWVAGKFMAKTDDFGKSDEITFMVTKDSVITKGTDNITFSGVNIEDNVKVDYIQESFLDLKAVHVTIIP